MNRRSIAWMTSLTIALALTGCEKHVVEPAKDAPKTGTSANPTPAPAATNTPPAATPKPNEGSAIEKPSAAKPSTEKSAPSLATGPGILAHQMNLIDGQPKNLGDYKGKVVLIVNVASKCGLTPQYDALESLYKSKKDAGLVVLGFPANDFGSQEPGTNKEIAEFCTATYHVSFPMFEKIAVTGEGQHPLYRALTSAKPGTVVPGDGFREQLKGYGITPNPEPGVLWNFEKFLVSRTGEVVGRFAPDTAPDDPRLIAAIEAELAKA